MANNLSLSLKIDIKPFSEGIKSALKIGQMFGKQIDGILSGKVTADTSSIDAELKNLKKNLGAIGDKAVSIDGDASGAVDASHEATSSIDGVPDDKETDFNGDDSEVINASNNATDAIGGVPDEKETIFSADVSSALTGIAHLSMAYQGIQAVIDKVKQKILNAFSPIYDFGQTMAQLESISGATIIQMKLLADQAKELGASTEYSASEVGSLQVEFSKLGFSANEISKVTEGVLDLATASGENLKESATIAGATLRGFGLDVSNTGRVTDVMAKSFSSSALDLFKFKESMKMVAPISKAVGFEIEETTAMLGKLADSGIHGSLAGTGLKTILSTMGDESSKLAQVLGGTATTFDEFVVLLEKAKARGKEFNEDALKELSPRMNTALLSLVDASDGLTILETKLNNASGAAKKMADIQRDTLKGATDEFNSALEGTLIALGQKLQPILIAIIDTGAKFFSMLTDNSNAVLGVITSMGVLIITIKGMQVAQAALNVVQAIGAALMGNWIGLAVAAAAGLAVYAIQANLTEKKQDKLNTSIQEGTQSYKDLLKAQRAFADGVSFENIYGEINGVNAEIDTLLAKYGANQDTEFIINMSAEDQNSLDKLYVKQGALKEQMFEYEKQVRDAAKSIVELNEEPLEDKEFTVEMDILEDETADVFAKSREKFKKFIEFQDEARKTSRELELREMSMSDPYTARLERQKDATENWFAKKHDLLIASGMSEQQISESQSKAIENLEKLSMQKRIQQGAQGLGQMADNLASTGKIGFEVSKALNIAQVVMETPAAAMSAYKAVVGIPVVGPVLAPIAFGATIAQGAMSIAEITKAKPPKAEKGGLSGKIAGKSHAEGGVLIEAEGDEYITHKQRVNDLGVGFFDFLNFAPLSTVKSVLSGVTLPSMPSIPAPSPYMASGGYVTNNNQSISFGSLERKFDQLISKVSKLENNTVVNVNNRSKIDVHRENVQAEREYNRRMNR